MPLVTKDGILGFVRWHPDGTVEVIHLPTGQTRFLSLDEVPDPTGWVLREADATPGAPDFSRARVDRERSERSTGR